MSATASENILFIFVVVLFVDSAWWWLATYAWINVHYICHFNMSEKFRPGSGTPINR